MSKATAQVTDRFKRTYVDVRGQSTKAVQEAMFKMGFRWFYSGEDKRKAYPQPMNYIRVDENCEMNYCDSAKSPDDNGYYEYEKVTVASLLEAAEQVRQIKRAESKAQKKRAAARKWDATATKKTHDGQPVRDEVVVAYKMLDGEVDTDKAGSLFWGECGNGTIVSYKVLEKNKHKPNPNIVVSQDEMFADIAHSMGMGVAMQVGSLSALGGGVGSLSLGSIRESNNLCYKVDQSGNVLPDTNPKKQYGVASIPLEMWPDLASAYGALGLYNGSLKYGKANYANTPVEASIYIAAARRHLAAWCAGEEFDPADGVPNLGGVLANIAIILEARAAGTLIDDRMLQTGYLKERDALKALVKPLQVLHAEKNPKHYTKDQA